MSTMNSGIALNRRRFFQTGILASAGLGAVAGLPATPRAGAAKEERDPFAGLKVGMASYSLRKFTLAQAIEMTRKVGVKYICLKDMHLPMKSSPADRQAAREQVEAGGLRLTGAGVIYLKNDEEQIHQAFEYVKEAGMPMMVCSPEPAALGTVEQMAKRYNIRIAIHNHGPGDQQYPSPRDVLRLVKDRDPHMGLCMDIGHTVRIGEDPVEVIEECFDRLYDFHLKDETAAAPRGTATEVGRGVIDIVAVLRTLVRRKYDHTIHLEYEANADNPMPGIVESYAYVRGVLAAIG
jgi:inosose dehydratase